MNLPNRITLMRVILIPVFVVFMLIDIKYNNYYAFAVFVIACISDFFDGYLARKWNLVTNFGKFADPLADKILVSAALILFVGKGLMPEWAVIVIIAREFIISGVRLIGAESGVVIAAGMWGKVKTVVQMIMAIFLILDFDYYYVNVFEQFLIYASVALSVISLFDYLIKNRGLFIDKKV